MGHRANLRVARPLPTSDEGLGKSIESAEAWVLIAHIRRMTRLLAKP
jgi:hypothetical protein